MWGKSFSESLNALSNSSSVNREDAMLNVEKSCLLKSRRDIFWRRAVYSNRVLRADRKADVNQTCQQSVFSPIGACIRIWCKRVPWNGGPKCLSAGPQFPARLKACSQAKRKRKRTTKQYKAQTWWNKLLHKFFTWKLTVCYFYGFFVLRFSNAVVYCLSLQYFGDKDGRDRIHTTVRSLRTDRPRGSPLGQMAELLLKSLKRSYDQKSILLFLCISKLC